MAICYFFKSVLMAIILNGHNSSIKMAISHKYRFKDVFMAKRVVTDGEQRTAANKSDMLIPCIIVIVAA